MRRRLVFLIIAAAGTLATPSLQAQCPELVWSDEFDGVELDTDRWEPQIGNGCALGICGWGNAELQFYTTQNAVVDEGLLHIIAREQQYSGHSYTSSRLRTKEKAAWTSGRFEARMKLPKGQGIWPAFWMLPEVGGWPEAGEIDIMESIGHEPEWVHGTIHFGEGGNDDRQMIGDGFELFNGDFSDDFHEFAIEREPGVIRWYVDGYRYHEVTEADLGQPWPFDAPFHFLLNVAIGGQWPGNPDATTRFPDSLTVDYVRVYEGRRASIVGPRLLAYRQSGAVYGLEHLPEGAEVAWTVPEDAVIVSGQGTPQVTVDWGAQSGIVEAVVTTSCGSQRLAVDVRSGAPSDRLVSFAAFEGDDVASVGGRTTGTLEVVENPAPSAVNDSPNSGAYTRSSGHQYDVLYLEAVEDVDAAAFVEELKQFQMDLWTDAPPGTEIILQLENGGVTANWEYPRGRHSRFRAETSASEAWHRVMFSFLDRPDGGITGEGVASIVLLFAPDSHTGHTYVIDNFDAYVLRDEGGVGAVPDAPHRSAEGVQMTAHPNPFREIATISYTLDRTADVHLELFDITGRSYGTLWNGWSGPGRQQVVVRDHALPAGVYLVRLQVDDRAETLLLTHVR